MGRRFWVQAASEGETFAEKLRGYGIEAEASRQATRGVTRNFDSLWRVKAGDGGRLRGTKQRDKTGQRARLSRGEALQAWGRIAEALAASESVDDHHLAADVRRFVERQPVVQQALKQRRDAAQQNPKAPQQELAPRRQGPEISR